MSARLIWSILAMLLLTLPAAAQNLLAFRRQAAVSPGSATAQSLFPLTPKQGPVMVRVTSFAGEDALRWANTLAAELRQKHGIDAYVYRFQLSPSEERPTQEQVAAYKQRFKMAPRVPRLLRQPPENWVVLAGNFDSFESRGASKLHEKIQQLVPKSVPADVFARFRMHTKEGTTQAPLNQAMLVFNPLAPKDRKRLSDPDQDRIAHMLLQLNSDTDFSVYNLNAPYTMAVRQFRGLNVLDEEKADSIFSRGLLGGKKKTALQLAGQNAVVVAEQLRNMGYENTYVFHGQFASVVCVGGYQSPNDPQAMKDYQVFSRMQLNGLQLTPQVIPTPRRPEL